MKDSELLARLIYRSYVAGEAPPTSGVAFIPFCDSLEFYAKTRIRELIDEGKLELVSDSDAAPTDAEESTPALAPESPTVLAAPTFAAEEVRAVIPADTHTHTQPGPLTAEADSPSPSPAKDRAKSARSSNTCSASSIPTAARAAGSPRKPTVR